MQRFYKRRKTIFNICRFTVSLVGSYIVLSYGEPEGFLEIFYEPGFCLQLAINTIGFFALSLFISWLMNLGHPLISKLKYSAKSWIMLFLKAVVVPVTVLLFLLYAYFFIFGRQFGFSIYLKVIFPISFLVTIIFVVFDLISLSIYYSMVLARNSQMLKLQSLVPEKQFYGDEDDGFGKFYKIELMGRRVIGVDQHGDKYKLPYRTLKEIKELTEKDMRFFSTGSWIIQYEGIGSWKNDSNSRALKIYLKEPVNESVSLNKKDKRVFFEWYETSKRLYSQGK